MRYARGTSLNATVQLLEWGGGVAGLFAYGTFTAVAAGMLAVRTFGLLALAILCTRDESRLSWGLSLANSLEIKSMMAPSFGLMAFPMANALTFQGLTLLTGFVLGPAAVVVFNAYRTIARTTVQLTAILSHALWPEFSRLFGRGEFNKLRTIVLQSNVVGALCSLTLSIIVYAVAPTILLLWTRGRVEYTESLMSLFLLYAVITSIQHVPRTFLIATNSHSRLGAVVLCLSGFSLVAAYFLSQHFGSPGTVTAMILGEIVVAATTMHMAFKAISKKSNMLVGVGY